MHVSGEKAEFEFRVFAKDSVHPFRLQCRQAILRRALAKELLRDTLHFGAPITAVFQDDKRVSVKLNNEFICGLSSLGAMVLEVWCVRPLVQISKELHIQRILLL